MDQECMAEDVGASVNEYMAENAGAWNRSTWQRVNAWQRMWVHGTRNVQRGAGKDIPIRGSNQHSLSGPGMWNRVRQSYKRSKKKPLGMEQREQGFPHIKLSQASGGHI